MIDRKKAIEDLQYLHDRETWKEGIMTFDDHASDRRRITQHALELLKEQEAVKPQIDAFGHPYCPRCKVLVYQTWSFCPHCGQGVKWNG